MERCDWIVEKSMGAPCSHHGLQMAVNYNSVQFIKRHFESSCSKYPASSSKIVLKVVSRVSKKNSDTCDMRRRKMDIQLLLGLVLAGMKQRCILYVSAHVDPMAKHA